MGVRWVPLSAIEHWIYCPRQCVLIHVDQIFDENLYTIRGARFHSRVVRGETTHVGDTTVQRDLPLWSNTLRLRGRADVVEFRPDGPFPIEYKSGGRHGKAADAQLCAQAMCLEEMLETSITGGALFLGKHRRRQDVRFDQDLRDLVVQVTQEIRGALDEQPAPRAAVDARCRSCSLIDSCLPDVVGDRTRLERIHSSLFEVVADA